MITPDDSHKASNVKGNSNVTLLIDTEEPPRGVLIYGIAKPETDFTLESTAIVICEKYMSKDEV
jgi:general stress protein 26